jgi:D-alanyl-lipoteichoic acid acyltransferase DltB (MBOAT superfamily)
MWNRVRNTFIIFLVSGFWHGANWTFIVWGGLNALFIMPLILFNKNRDNFEIVAKGKALPSPTDFFNILLTFALTLFAWIFFRAVSVGHAFQFISGIFSKSLFTVPQVLPETLFLLIGIFLVIEWLGREQKFAIEHIDAKWPRMVRWSFYVLIIFCIGMFMQTEETPFIYFQF